MIPFVRNAIDNGNNGTSDWLAAGIPIKIAFIPIIYSLILIFYNKLSITYIYSSLVWVIMNTLEHIRA